ncbi:hypothetical protein BU16DRAFT_526054 [Lophium mytilinum]|uniref:Rhodopsin domain-containing protein n=1 Tax=Lophium mytilinum TaxID=390894 RepID=A0A6A6QX26_9PEZI|nr:hypothetical protein BU16DRAFT_526054 [Lophium mytilinum]
MLWAGQLSQIFAIGPAKISVLLFYNRIFRGRTFNIINWALIALVSMWMIGYFFANLLECVPISHSFINAPGINLDRKHCIDAVPMYLSQVYSDLVLDALILIVPLPLIWKLHLPVKQKIAVCCIFLLGVMAVAASCAKMIIFNFVGHQLELEPDVSYFLTPIVYWPMIQAALQIIGACLPMLRPLIPSFKGSRSGSSGRSRSGYIISDDGSRKSPSSHEGMYSSTSSYGM